MESPPSKWSAWLTWFAWPAELIGQLLGWYRNQPIQGGASSQTPTTQTFSPVVHDQGTANMAGRDITNNDYRSPNQKSTSVNNQARDISVSNSRDTAIGSIVNRRESCRR